MEQRLIDANALSKVMGDRLILVSVKCGMDSARAMEAAKAMAIVNAQPTIDAEPVRHGKWIEYPIADGMNQCSECGVLRFGDSNYCPNCGAKMDAE